MGWPTPIPQTPIVQEPPPSPPAPPPPPPSGAIRGSIWHDLNGNGKRDRREPALAGQAVFLDLNANGTLETSEPFTTSADNGTYAFSGLEVGAYEVRVVVPEQWRATGVHGAMQQAGVTTRKAIKLRPTGLTDRVTIGGTIFADLNANSQLDSGEGAFRKAKVFLDLNDDGQRQKTEPAAKLDKAGNWRFSGLTPGLYVVRIAVKPTFVFTMADPAGRASIDARVPATDVVDHLAGVAALSPISAGRR